MHKAQPGLVLPYKLEMELFQEHATNTGYVEKAKNRNGKVKED